AEVAFRLGLRAEELCTLVRQHGIPVKKDRAGKLYLWTEQAIGAVQQLLEDLAKREPPPRPSGLTSKQVARRLRVKYETFIQFARTARSHGLSIEPARHKGGLYWREEDVLILEEALQKHLAKPDLKQKREAGAQKARFTHLRAHAAAIAVTVRREEGKPWAADVQRHIEAIRALCEEIEAASTISMTFFNTVPLEGWTLRQPISVWVRAVSGGFEAVPVDFDLRIRSTTRQGAVGLLRHALCQRYQELARDPAQDTATWAALQQFLVPPE
ncbi:MAG TPA: hypothetical protein VGK45_14930, partial [Thermoanaerobaculia bacterium]